MLTTILNKVRFNWNCYEKKRSKNCALWIFRVI